MEIIKASLDRFEGDYAIIYSNSDGRRFDIARERVNLRAGSRLVLYLDRDNIIRVELDNKSTRESKDRIRRKYQRLIRKDI